MASLTRDSNGSENGRPTTVWLVPTRLDDPVPQAAMAVLDALESERAERFRFDNDRVVYTWAHLALRVLLGAELGAPATSLAFRSSTCPLCGEPHGRPVLADRAGPDFSVAHTRGLVAIAISDRPVGVDVERMDTVDAEAVPAMLHPQELRQCAAPGLTARQSNRRAIDSWVRKESLLKAVGTGLGLEPSNVLAGTEDRWVDDPLTGEAGRWWIAGVDAGEEHLGAVTVAALPTGAVPTVEVRRLDRRLLVEAVTPLIGD